MEKNDIEILKASTLPEHTFKSRLLIYWVDISTKQFYQYNQAVSSEFLQDLVGVFTNHSNDIIKDVIIENIKDSIKVTPEFMLEKFNYDNDIKKYVLPYIREEKINKLINEK